MIIRLSGKLAGKIRVSPPKSLPLDSNLYADWSAHLFTAARVRYILVTNTVSLFSMVTYGKRITTGDILANSIRKCMSEFLRDYRLEHILETFILPSSGEVSFSKALNRRVTGSMNDLVYFAKCHLIEDNLSPFEAALKLNEMPMSYLNYEHPRKAFERITN